MIGTYGMSETLGPLAYDKQGGNRFLGQGNSRAAPERSTAKEIDEVRALVDRGMKALEILHHNRGLRGHRPAHPREGSDRR